MKKIYERKFKEAYFSKDIYSKKAEYAGKIAREGIEKIANDIIFKKYKYKDWNDVYDKLENSKLSDKQFDSKIKKLEDEIEYLVIELEPIRDISHARHEMHSTDIRSDDSAESAFYKLGTLDAYKGDFLIDKVNKLNKKYKLSKINIDIPKEPPSGFWQDSEDILDDFGEDVPDDENDANDLAYALLYNAWREIQDKVSDNIRKFFKDINNKFDTNFPD